MLTVEMRPPLALVLENGVQVALEMFVPVEVPRIFISKRAPCSEPWCRCLSMRKR